MVKKNIFEIPSIKLLEKKQPSKNLNSKNPSTEFIEKILLNIFEYPASLLRQVCLNLLTKYLFCRNLLLDGFFP